MARLPVPANMVESMGHGYMYDIFYRPASDEPDIGVFFLPWISGETRGLHVLKDLIFC